MIPFSFLEGLGYLASILILISMLLNSILKLRVVNLFGAAIFSIYGFSIGSLPVGFLNLFVVFANIYHLYKIIGSNDSFSTLEIRNDNRYLIKFLDFHANDINRYFPGFSYDPQLNTFSFLILRNMAVAGVFLARDYGQNRLYIGLDFVIKEYRDLKPGKFIYSEKTQFFKEKGYKSFCTIPQTTYHEKYLKKMGFKELYIDDKKHFTLDID